MTETRVIRWRLGHGLRVCRAAAGLSQAQVAAGLYGASELVDLVGDLEDGRIDGVSLDLLLRLAAVLGVGLGELAARGWVEVL